VGYRLETKIDAILASVQRMEAKMTALDDAFTALTAQVTANTSAEASAVLLIQKIAALIQANATSPTQVTALATQLKSSADALAAAVVANTPAGP
jgi:hypothetical protein